MFIFENIATFFLLSGTRLFLISVSTSIIPSHQSLISAIAMPSLRICFIRFSISTFSSEYSRYELLLRLTHMSFLLSYKRIVFAVNPVMRSTSLIFINMTSYIANFPIIGLF